MWIRQDWEQREEPPKVEAPQAVLAGCERGARHELPGVAPGNLGQAMVRQFDSHVLICAIPFMAEDGSIYWSNKTCSQRSGKKDRPERQACRVHFVFRNNHL